MAITLRNAGTWAAITANSAVTLPTHQAGDMLIVRVASKSAAASTETITISDSGWAKIGQGNNGTTNSGNGTGSVIVAAFYKIATSASETNPTVSFSSGPSPGAVVAMAYQKAITEVWMTPVGDDGPDTTAGTTHSATIATNVQVKTGDLVDFFTGICDDTTMTVPTITQTGVTFDTVTESPSGALSSTTGSDIAADGGYRTATAGISSAAAVVTGTTSTSETGTSWMTRLRVVPLAFGQAQAKIKATARGYGQAQALINNPAYVLRTVDIIADTSDSYIESQDLDLQTARAGSNLGVNDTDTFMSVESLDDGAGGFTFIESMLAFSTSTIPTSVNIQSAIITLFGGWSGSDNSDVMEARIFDWGASVTTGDFISGNNLGNNPLVASITATDYTGLGSHALTDSGLVSYISIGSTLRLALNSMLHRTNGIVGGSSQLSNFSISTANHGTAAQRPKLTVTYYVYLGSALGQAQAKIEAGTPNVHGQAQAQIKQTYYVNAQAQAQIKQVYYQHGQAQASISIRRDTHGQAQAVISRNFGSVTDTFTRSETDQLGTADVGGAWSLASGTASSWDVDGSRLVFTAANGSTTFQQLREVLLDSLITKISYDITIASLPASGQVDITVGFARGAVGVAGPGIIYQSDGDILVSRNNGLTASDTQAVGTVELGATYHVLGIVYASHETPYNNTFRYKAWKDGDVEPGWFIASSSNSFLLILPAGIRIDPAAAADSFTIDNISIEDFHGQEYGQAQARIIGIPKQSGQAQAQIKQTYYQHGQAQAQIKTIYFGLGQAQGLIKNTYFGLGQAQAQIKQTYPLCICDESQLGDFILGEDSLGGGSCVCIGAFGQAQAEIVIAEETTKYKHGQAQAWIENTYNGHGQAQGTIKQTYYQHGQSQAWIENTYNGHGQAQGTILRAYTQCGQAQGTIKTTYYAHGQAQADIKATSYAHGQAQAQIKTTYYVHGQSQAWIENTYYAHGQAQGTILRTYTQCGQAQGQIKTTYYGHGQAQAWIETTYTQHGQAQGTILRTYYVHGQSQAQIKTTYYAHGQAQGTILRTYEQCGQAQGQIKQTYNSHGQAQATIRATYNAHGQAQAQIKTTYYQHGQAQAKINAFGVNVHGQAQAYINVPGTNAYGQAQAKIRAFGVNAHGQAQGWIETTTNQHGQAQGQVKQTYNQHGQANASIVNTNFASGQAQASIKAITSSCGQAQASIKQTSASHGQAQAWIENTYTQSGQAQAYILLVRFGSGQAQAQIKNTYNQSGQAQGTVLQTYYASGNAQSLIKTTVNSSGQAQALIGARYNAHGQAQASITSGTMAHGQAQAFIHRGEAFGQAQAFIVTAHTLKNVLVDDERAFTTSLEDELLATRMILEDELESVTITVEEGRLTVTVLDERTVRISINDEAF